METKIPAIYKALDAVNRELQGIAKDQAGYGYKFRGVNQVYEYCSPIFKKHGIIIAKRNLEVSRELRTVEAKNGTKTISSAMMKCTYRLISLEDGSYIETESANEGQDSSGGDKAVSICNSTNFRNAILELFVISTEELLDNDMATAKEKEAEVKTSAFSKVPEDKAKEVGNSFRKKVQIPKIDDEEI
jgi:hypothetical protein